jgi:hypothetical protein
MIPVYLPEEYLSIKAVLVLNFKIYLLDMLQSKEA